MSGHLGPSAIALVAANLAVALFCALRGWGYYETLLVYWLEALIIGVYNILRLLVVGLFGEQPFGRAAAEQVEVTPGARVFFTLLGTGFFAFKYGGLALTVGFLAVLAPAFMGEPDDSQGMKMVNALSDTAPGVGTAAALLVLSHGFSFVRNFLVGCEYRRTNALGLIFLPYVRMWLVLLVMAAGFTVAAVWPGAGRSTVFAVVVVLAKTTVDLVSHAAEHRRMAARAPDPSREAVLETVYATQLGGTARSRS